MTSSKWRRLPRAPDEESKTRRAGKHLNLDAFCERARFCSLSRPTHLPIILLTGPPPACALLDPAADLGCSAPNWPPSVFSSVPTPLPAYHPLPPRGISRSIITTQASTARAFVHSSRGMRWIFNALYRLVAARMPANFPEHPPRGNRFVLRLAQLMEVTKIATRAIAADASAQASTTSKRKRSSAYSLTMPDLAFLPFRPLSLMFPFLASL